MSDYVYPTGVMVVRYQGGRIHLKPDQRWEERDPFVKARPDLFRSDSAQTAHSPGYTPVEQATKGPGEQRATRRPAKKAASSE